MQDNKLKKLIDKAEKYVAFIGSGLSIGIYPTWEGLVSQLCKVCGLPTNIPSSNKSSEDLLKLADEAKRCDKKAYCKELGKIFGKKITKTNRSYKLLMKLQFKSYITINFDRLLASEAIDNNYKNIFSFPSLPYNKINDHSIFYIHGYIEENTIPQPDHILLGERDFERGYENNYSGTLKSFLEQVFTYEPLLFIGCKLSEPPLRKVLETCRKIRKTINESYPSHNPPPRFAILPKRYYKSEIRNPEHDIDAEKEENDRFGELDIEVYRYEPKDEDHTGLLELLESLCDLQPQRVLSGFEETY